MDGEIAQNLQQPANAEARKQATMLRQDLQASDNTAMASVTDSPMIDVIGEQVQFQRWAPGPLAESVFFIFQLAGVVLTVHPKSM